ncbi:dUTP diphosphatase [Candidatus Peregrinibacteria bacterium]|nr:dUTP diphosphatase [Candidatus Peregrinibacteria bacterium]
MEIRLKRIDPTLPLPRYETSGAVGFDLYAREATSIQPRGIVLIPSNFIIEVPQGYALIVASRSSAPRKWGITPPHGIGVIDQDYHGPEDEIKIQVMNFTDQPVTIKKGERVAQAIFVRADQIQFKEVSEIKKESRGGFGSTG